MRAPVTDPLITLRSGHVVRASVAEWLINSSFRLNFTIDGRDLLVKPRTAITPGDDLFIKTHKQELLAAVADIDRQCEAPL